MFPQYREVYPSPKGMEWRLGEYSLPTNGEKAHLRLHIYKIKEKTDPKRALYE